MLSPSWGNHFDSLLFCWGPLVPRLNIKRLSCPPCSLGSDKNIMSFSRVELPPPSRMESFSWLNFSRQSGNRLTSSSSELLRDCREFNDGEKSSSARILSESNSLYHAKYQESGNKFETQRGIRKIFSYSNKVWNLPLYPHHCHSKVFFPLRTFHSDENRPSSFNRRRRKNPRATRNLSLIGLPREISDIFTNFHQNLINGIFMGPSLTRQYRMSWESFEPTI